MMTDDWSSRTADNLAIVRDAVRSEIEAALNRKASFENRGIAVLTLELGVATLYLALRTALKIEDALAQPLPAWTVSVSLGLSALALVLAILVSWPARIDVLSTKRIIDLQDSAREADVYLSGLLVNDFRQQLATLNSKNSVKGVLLTVCLSVSAASIIGLGSATFWAIANPVPTLP